MEQTIPKLSSAVGLVPGPYRQETMVCQYIHIANSEGSVWFGGDPFVYSTPLLLVQFGLIFLLTRFVFFFLKPFKQSIMSAQIIAGIIMGPSFLAQHRAYAEKLLSPGSRLVLNTFADLGFMLHLFIIGVQIDVAILKKAGKSAVLIGTTGFVLAVTLGGLGVVILTPMAKLDDIVLESLPVVVSVNAISSFAVTTSLLADLNILNSEMGRLASFTSLVVDFWSYFVAAIMLKVGAAVRTSRWELLWSIVWIAFFAGVIVFVFRPLILIMGNRIPEGKTMKESHFIAIIVIVLACGFIAEVLGQHCAVGSFMLGMVVPDGPPLGEGLVYKLEAMSTGLFLPAKYVITGLNVDLGSVKSSSAGVVEVIIIAGYIGKFLGTLATALFCSLPFWDAVSLALVMCCKGIVDIAVYCILKDEGVVTNQEYALLMITMLVVTGVARILIGHLYDPSRRYMVHNRSNIQDSHRHNVDLRVLICIHNEEHVPTLINLLEASNPTKHSLVSVFILTLMELKGRAAAIMVPNFRRGKLTSTVNHSKHILNAFNYYAQANQGRVFLQHLTAMAPYSSMHDDICMLALDKSVTIVIVPFHKQWTVDGTVGAIFPSVRSVNQNVINKAPCSVGILVDRSQMSGGWSAFTTRQCLFRVASLFLGGADDQEALAYGSRMVDHPLITLTVVWIRPSPHKNSINEMEDPHDIELMEDCKAKAMNKRRMVFREEMVEDAEGTTRVIHSMEDSFDLFVVGRYHEPDSPLTLGLTEWSECPELGVIGDLLSSSDFRFSVLVVQQQPRGNCFVDANVIRRGGSRRDVGS